jgi:transcriptional regulator with XRE-family HTH domain
MAKKTLGAHLRELRTDRGLGLREAATLAGLNHGYLSQLERDEVAQPAPAVLQKLAAAYEEPFLLLMRWAGYLEDDPDELSPNQARALKIVGDPSNEELRAIKAVLNAIRTTRATFAAHASLDGGLSPEDQARIRGHAIALLRKADTLGEIPTPLDDLMEVSRLVATGEITLEPELKRKLRQRFGDLVDRALDLILGSVQFASREVYLKPGMYHLRRRFVQAHEIGHELLPWHRALYAFLDDKTRIRADISDLYERQANQAAIEILAQGDQLRKEADDSPLSFDWMDHLGSRYEISTQASTRRIVEESKQACALVIAYRGSATGMLMPAHLYCSRTFEERFRWHATGRAAQVIQARLVAAQRDEVLEPFMETDMRGRLTTIELDSLSTPQAVFVLFCCVPTKSKLLSRVALTR